jgi:hypothetical protein
MNGHRSAPGSASNSSGLSTNGISPVMMVEQKRMTREVTPPGLRNGQRRSPLSYTPDSGSDQVATRWNPNGIEPAFENRSSRRHSALPAFSNSPRSISPEQKRSFSPASASAHWSGLANGNGTATPPLSALRNGAISPVSTLRADATVRSSSPLRSELMTPMTPGGALRSHSPAKARNGNGTFTAGQEAAQQHQQALAALQGQLPQPTPISHAQKGARQRLSLLTQIPPTNGGPPATVPEQPEEEEEEEEVEVIAMSPAVREPIMSFRKSRSSLALSTMSPYMSTPGYSALASGGLDSTLEKGGLDHRASMLGRVNSQVNLSGMNLTATEAKKPYFGQMIEASDLIATGLENAFLKL